MKETITQFRQIGADLDGLSGRNEPLPNRDVTPAPNDRWTTVLYAAMTGPIPFTACHDPQGREGAWESVR